MELVLISKTSKVEVTGWSQNSCWYFIAVYPGMLGAPNKQGTINTYCKRTLSYKKFSVSKNHVFPLIFDSTSTSNFTVGCKFYMLLNQTGPHQKQHEYNIQHEK